MLYSRSDRVYLDSHYYCCSNCRIGDVDEVSQRCSRSGSSTKVVEASLELAHVSVTPRTSCWRVWTPANITTTSFSCRDGLSNCFRVCSASLCQPGRRGLWYSVAERHADLIQNLQYICRAVRTGILRGVFTNCCSIRLKKQKCDTYVYEAQHTWYSLLLWCVPVVVVALTLTYTWCMTEGIRDKYISMYCCSHNCFESCGYFGQPGRHHGIISRQVPKVDANKVVK